ncbi:homoserine dehydrogenase [Anaerobaca lacustris]|uniref:Homoserine dehydrogenase n=1 Tax=Anaerobaca lacustris TaxID=3044600 RepID=A0AAW6TW33_9BACT|nr:homoserine dehydrogenase [Sedimentisphaerales bacterium M17dextr]
MDEKRIRVGLVGFGTVGTGVARLICEEGDAIAEKTGVRLELACVVDVDTTTPRPVRLPDGVLTNDIHRLLADESITVGVELVGGTGVARTIQLDMLGAGKDVVTANKALLAEHGAELYRVARRRSRCIAFEASCAGGIPIIAAIRTGLAANNIRAMYGIVNGTCNYILSSMSAKDEEFAAALAQAQQRGFAEADPTLDITGGDSAHKLAILASMAFGYEISLDDIFVRGIDGIAKEDIRYGREMGYCLKLLAIGLKNEQGKVSLRVHPSFIAADCSLARVDGSFNAISIFGSAVGETLYYGRGAGMMPTASAVVADILDVALGNSRTTFEHLRLKPREEVVPLIEDINDSVSRFYIRVMAQDVPGVVACYGRILGDHQISISGALQHEGRGPDNTVPVVITTHRTQERNMAAALAELARSELFAGQPVCIRIEDIPEDRDV